MKTFGGPVLFLDRSDINTDEIIPAKYLTEITKEDLKPYILEDLKLPGFDPKGRNHESGPGDRVPRQLRLRLFPRACPLGLRGERHHRRHRRVLCPHLPPEHVQLRHGGDRTEKGVIDALFSYQDCPDAALPWIWRVCPHGAGRRAERDVSFRNFPFRQGAGAGRRLGRLCRQEILTAELFRFFRCPEFHE